MYICFLALFTSFLSFGGNFHFFPGVFGEICFFDSRFLLSALFARSARRRVCGWLNPIPTHLNQQELVATLSSDTVAALDQHVVRWAQQLHPLSSTVDLVNHLYTVCTPTRLAKWNRARRIAEGMLAGFLPEAVRPLIYELSLDCLYKLGDVMVMETLPLPQPQLFAQTRH